MMNLPRILLLMLFVSFSACKKEKDIELNDKGLDTGSISDTIGRGSFIGVSKNLSGTASLIRDTSNALFLRLENFTMNSSPDAFVYLSPTANYQASTAVNVYTLTPNTNFTSTNITIPLAGLDDGSTNRYVIVWCRQFNAFFGHAPLN